MSARSSALAAAALLGLSADLPSASAAGCFPKYSSGASYKVGEWVSATTTEETSPAGWESCTVGTAGCPSTGYKYVQAVKVTSTHNYQCTNAAWCSNSAYYPGGIYEGSAWDKEAATCSGTASLASLAPALWSLGGCPKAFASGTAYDAGDVVSVKMNGYTSVFQCAEEPSNQFCGMAQYEPGDGQFGDVVWTELGSCSGTLAPTDSPSFNVLTDAGGCPSEYSGGEKYEEGDRVSKNGFVYQCKGWPNSQHCSQAGYEPGNNDNGLDYWTNAWDITGYCSGTIAPTVSPSYVYLQDLGGCPDAWEAKNHGGTDPYEEGDRVSSMGLVYQCKAWPYSNHCGQAGYEPNHNPATPDAWKDAWTVMGYCNGSIGPTTSPTGDYSKVGACPDEWESGTNIKYEEGDMVSITVSAVPLRKVAFRCKAWPYSGHCGQFRPDQFGGNMGWAVAGSCDGSIGPTSSPSFDRLKAVAGGCPAEYSRSTTNYEAGDIVSVTVSASPIRKIVYECKSWPNSGYCNQHGTMAPGEYYGNMGWTLKGSCSGTMAPTDSPVPYTGTCTYIKCKSDVTCNKDAASNGVAGSTACSCTTANQAACTDYNTSTKVGTKGKQKVCSVTTVGKYSSSTSYDFDDVVRVGTQRFKCGHWPNGLWCNNSAYKPTKDAGIWSQAWSKDGTCT